MMPAFVKAVLRKFSAGLVLLVLIAALLAWPARHVLEPLWLSPVEELLYMAPGGEAGRVFVSARRANGPPQGGRLLARGRPLSVVRVELVDGNWRHGYLLGVRSAPDHALHDDIPNGLLATMAEPHMSDYDTLVLVSAEEEQLDIPVEAVRRLIYPNRLAVSERAGLAWQRFAERIAERLPDGAHGLFIVPDMGSAKPSPSGDG